MTWEPDRYLEHKSDPRSLSALVTLTIQSILGFDLREIMGDLSKKVEDSVLSSSQYWYGKEVNNTYKAGEINLPVLFFAPRGT